ncbi:hypothetical protein [Jiangella mangrovi]|uniref:Uncharacterized protein n=1 Tax=Jiangella mangrovi TaxID=1524084 RepID=A0A7W9GVW0_9ACTN|nr:hypothetical protein [Jiangella mangrovi]MBB5790626.1 hypothetical protein [Jiangella mangrovi]
MRPVRVTAVLAAILLAATAAGCDGGGDDPGDEPSPTPSSLPAAAEGRLSRIMGDGSGESLTQAQAVPGTPLRLPVFLTEGRDGDLVGSQWGRGLFDLAPDGLARPLTDDDQDPWHVPVTVLAGDEHLLALADDNAEARLGTISLDDGEFTEVATLTDQVENVPVSALLELPDGIHVQWAGTWWRVDGDADDPTGVEQLTPPVEGIIASARTASGVAVLTPAELVLLDESLQETARTPWSIPAELSGQSVTAVTGDGGDGLFVGTGIPGSRGGGLLHVTADGVDLLAAGVAPDGDDPDCDNADQPALEAHLGFVAALVVWQDRLIVADDSCSSLLQLPLPAAG